MKKSRRYYVALSACVAGVVLAGAWIGAEEPDGRLLLFRNARGVAATFDAAGPIDESNPFFESLGTNGRSCATCHVPSDAWSITPAQLRRRFVRSRGLDPIFHSNDGSNCEGAAPATIDERRAASSMLLSKGLIRVGLTVPADAEFTIASVDDPFGCGAPLDTISAFRRPLPSTNLRFLSTVMWDGRETKPGQTIMADLADQARDATLGHAQASLTPTDREIGQIVAFETSLYTAQLFDARAGVLDRHGATGGPLALTRQPFFIGINDPFGGNPTGAAFDRRSFTLFAPWAAPRRSHGRDDDGDDRPEKMRAAIARGETLFNTGPITITGVAGLNDNPALGPSFTGTCSTCHDTPNAGDHSVSAPLNIGVSDAALRTPDLPLYTLRNKLSGEEVRTTDPGRAMITGKWSDIGKFKGPILRNLAARAPYFHNGAAATLEEAVDFYDTRFHLNLTPGQKSDLVAFLGAL